MIWDKVNRGLFRQLALQWTQKSRVLAYSLAFTLLYCTGLRWTILYYATLCFAVLSSTALRGLYHSSALASS